MKKDVEIFFDGYVHDFDSIYGHNHERSKIGKIADKIFRKSMYERFRMTLEFINDKNLNTILDVGCGTGIYSLEYLKMGKDIVGIDLAKNMVDLSNAVSKEHFPNGKFEFIKGDYLSYEFDTKFDVAVLMGLFDYIKDAGSLLAKLKVDTKGMILGSFPKSNHYLAPYRRIRYRLMKCPLYLYNYNQIESLIKKNDFNN